MPHFSSFFVICGPITVLQPARISLLSCLVMLLTFNSVQAFQSATTRSAGDDSTDQELSLQIAQALKPLLAAHKGRAACAVKLLDEENRVKASWQYAGRDVMPTASLIKLPILVELYRQIESGRLSASQLVELRDEDKVPGSGVLTEHFSSGAQLPLRDVARLMIRYSDNTATNLVLDQIGLESTAKTMAGLGLLETQAHSKVYRRDTSIALQRSEKYGLGSTTAEDMVSLLLMLQRNQLAAAKTCEEIREHLMACEDRSKIPSLLPPGTKVAHKTGAVNRVRTDAGIIYAENYTILLCVLTAENDDTRWTDDNAAHQLCGRVAKTVFDLVAAPPEPAAADTSLAAGAFGEQVEHLQRTLNDRIGAGLSVDGDFGPATEAAVLKYQQRHKLAATGVVDSKTWQALSPLITTDAPVPAPEVVNQQSLPLGDPLDPWGVPTVSAKAWTVWPIDSARPLAGSGSDTRLPMASTTKLMTACVVLDLARSHPDLLEETVTYSQRADKTIGSTSAVRAGEQLSVHETLFGLLLPSGNDASVALAEHVGGRLEKANIRAKSGSESAAEPRLSADGADAAYDAFVAAMNRKAEELGLANTHFTNTHGLTAEGHYSSANDLAKLTRYALKLPGLRTYVGCRQRGCRLRSLDGYTRDVVWKNTNRLLAQPGFFGVKTGTTSAAGACLIAAGTLPSRSLASNRAEAASRRSVAGEESSAVAEAGGQECIVVILGAETSTARYEDARNLFAWAARQLER